MASQFGLGKAQIPCSVGQLQVCSTGLLHPWGAIEPPEARLRAVTRSGRSGASREAARDPVADQQGYGRGCSSPLCQKEGRDGVGAWRALITRYGNESLELQQAKQIEYQQKVSVM